MAIFPHVSLLIKGSYTIAVLPHNRIAALLYLSSGFILPESCQYGSDDDRHQTL
mgnify:CR=1 FL=1